MTGLSASNPDKRRYAVRVKGGGLVTTVDDRAITTLDEAEAVAALIRRLLGGECVVEQVVLHIPEDGR